MSWGQMVFKMTYTHKQTPIFYEKNEEIKGDNTRIDDDYWNEKKREVESQ